MNTPIRALLVGAILTFAAFALPNVTGAWKGRMVITKLPTVPKEQQAQLDNFVRQSKAMVIDLKMSPKGTFNLTLKGGPAGMPMTAEGTWTLKGSNLTLKTLKTDGKAVKDPDQKFIVAKDGKSFYTPIPGGNGGEARLVFTR